MNVGLNDMPPCVPICRGRLPKAPTETDLLLKYVIPRNNQSAKIIYSDYLANNKYRLFSGDRLVYECTTEFWGVFGGVDTSYENFRYYSRFIWKRQYFWQLFQYFFFNICGAYHFRCTDDGTYDTPAPNEFWPRCSAQQGSKFIKPKTSSFLNNRTIWKLNFFFSGD